MKIMLKLTSQNNRQVGTLEDTDRLNTLVAPEVKEELNSALNQPGSEFILNLQNIKFIDSTGIGVLISALKTARQNNRPFLLANVSAEVMNLFKMMKLEQVFDFQTS